MSTKVERFSQFEKTLVVQHNESGNEEKSFVVLTIEDWRNRKTAEISIDTNDLLKLLKKVNIVPLVVLIALIALASVGCKTSSDAQTITNKEKTARTLKSDLSGKLDPDSTPDSHICGAPTKAGGKCKKRVKGQGNEFCWMHKAQGDNTNK